MNTINTARQMTYTEAFAQGNVLDDGSVELFLDTVEGYVETPKKPSIEYKFFPKDLYEILGKIMGIDATTWRNLVDGRGMRPVKAAIKLGAKADIAQLVGDLKLAVTAEEIDTVYADERCKSCMTGCKVGRFWEINGVGVIYAPNFRLLVGLVTKGLNPQAYGFKGNTVHDLLEPFFDNEEAPVESSYVWKREPVAYGREVRLEKEYVVWTIHLGEETDKAIVETFLAKGIEEKTTSGGFMRFSNETLHTKPFPFIGKYKLSEKACNLPGENNQGFGYRQTISEFERVSDDLGFHYIESDSGSYKFLEVKEVEKSHILYRDESRVSQIPKVQLGGDHYHPFIDFDTKVLSDKKAEEKIKELNLTLQVYNKADYDDIPF